MKFKQKTCDFPISVFKTAERLHRGLGYHNLSETFRIACTTYDDCHKRMMQGWRLFRDDGIEQKPIADPVFPHWEPRRRYNVHFTMPLAERVAQIAKEKSTIIKKCKEVVVVSRSILLADRIYREMCKGRDILYMNKYVKRCTPPIIYLGLYTSLLSESA